MTAYTTKRRNEMTRLAIVGALIAWCVTSSVLAQGSAAPRAPAPVRPPVFLSQGWQALADLMPGSGHGPGGYVNVGRIEVYGDAVKR
jgi:hypothetical protein